MENLVGKDAAEVIGKSLSSSGVPHPPSPVCCRTVTCKELKSFGMVRFVVTMTSSPPA
jgi:hypothetical protein